MTSIAGARTESSDADAPTARASFAMVGLGRMGGNMARRLMRGGHALHAFDRDERAREPLRADGASTCASLAELASSMRAPRAVWLMLPAGAPTESAVADLAVLLEPGDLVIDGGNSNFQDDVRRARDLSARGLLYADVGTSGGVWGLERGYCLMAGGEPRAFALLEPFLRTLAPGRDAAPPTPGREGRASTAEQGYLHCGPAGAGHFAKMIHNGIEYGLMQAYAEGFDLLRSASSPELPEERRFDFRLDELAELWRRGSVVGSWLLDLTASALAVDPELARYSGVVQDSGEGRWTLQAAIDEAVPTPVLAAALFARFRSRREHTYAEKVLSAMRAGFGGHTETRPTFPTAR